MTTFSSTGILKISEQYKSKSPSESFTADDLLSAWEDGKECGRNEIIGLVYRTRRDNTNRAINFCKESYKILNKRKIKCNAIFLNDEAIENIHILIMIDEADFANNKLLKAISDFDELIKTTNTESLNIYYKFMPLFKEINESLIVSDGFTVLYDGKQIKIHRSRTTQ